MSTETMARHRQEEMPEDDPSITVLDQEPEVPEYGVYRPGRRVLGSMAASAAAGEFLRNTGALLAAGARPEPDSPVRPDGEEWLEEATVRIA
jgi:hypothetical protein